MDLEQYSQTSEIQGPTTLYSWPSEPWEDFVSRVVGEITICVPYANHGRVLRPLLGRLRPSSHRRIQRSEDLTVYEPIFAREPYDYTEKGLAEYEIQESTGSNFEQLHPF